MTFGQIREQLKRQFAKIDLDTLDVKIMFRHQEILDALEWERLTAQESFNTVAEYTEGTVDVGSNSTTLIGVGVTWDSTMAGRLIRIAGRSDYYRFDPDDTEEDIGYIERPYAGDTETDLSYRINQSIYAMSEEVRDVTEVRIAGARPPLKHLSKTEADELFPNRNEYGCPRYYVKTFDDSSSPPRIQIELLPIPTTVQGVIADVVRDSAGFVLDDEGYPVETASLLPWTRPACLIAGVTADCLRLEKDYAGAQLEEARFEKLQRDMKRIDCARKGPSRIKLGDSLTRMNRARRGREHVYYTE